MAAEPRLIQRAFALDLLYTTFATIAAASLLPVVPLFVRGPLGGGDIAVGVTVSGALLVAAVAQPLLGRLADRRGRRLLLLGGPIAFGLLVLTFTVVDSPTALFAARAVAGLGDAAFTVGAITLMNDVAPPSRQGEAYSVWSLASWAGLGLGPVIGDAVLDGFSYDAVWLVSAGFAALAGLTALVLPETADRAAPPPRGPLLHRAAIVPGVALAFEIVGFFSFVVFASLYAQEVGVRAGLVFLTEAVVVVLVRTIGRAIPDRLGARRSASTGIVIVAVALLAMSGTGTGWGLFLGAGLLGLGHAILFPALFLLAVVTVDVSEKSAAVGTLKGCESAGAAIGPVLAGAVASALGYRWAFAFAAAVTVTALVPLALSRGGRSLRGRRA